MRSVKDFQNKIKDIEQKRKQCEKPVVDAIGSVVAVSRAHANMIEREVHAPERAKAFERIVQRAAGHVQQVETLDKQIADLHNGKMVADFNHNGKMAQLDSDKKAKGLDYSRHNRDHLVLRGLMRGITKLKPEHAELLKNDAKRFLSPEVAEWVM